MFLNAPQISGFKPLSVCLLSALMVAGFSAPLRAEEAPVVAASPQAPRYALADLEALAQRQSPVFLLIGDQIEAAKAGIRTAQAFPNPELEWLSGPSKARVPDVTTGNTRSSSLVQPLDLPNKRSARIAAAEAALSVAQASGSSDVADLISKLRLRYYELLRREAELRAAREDLSLIEAIRHRIAKRVEVGESPRFELIKVDTETLNAQKAVHTAGVLIRQAKAGIRQLVGHTLPADFEISGKLTDVTEPPSLEKVRTQILETNPEIQRARAEVRQQEARLDQAHAQRWPDLALKAGRDEDPDLRTTRVGLVMTVPLWDWKSGPIAEARAQLSQARYQLSQQEITLAQNLELAYQRLEIAQNQVQALENGIIRQAEAALKVAEAAYRFGERGFIDVLDAQRVFRFARNELIAARYEFASACSEIERLRTRTVFPTNSP